MASDAGNHQGTAADVVYVSSATVRGQRRLGRRRRGERPLPVHRAHGQDGCDSRGQVKEREAADNNSPHRDVAAHASEADCLFVIL